MNKPWRKNDWLALDRDRSSSVFAIAYDDAEYFGVMEEFVNIGVSISLCSESGGQNISTCSSARRLVVSLRS